MAKARKKTFLEFALEREAKLEAESEAITAAIKKRRKAKQAEKREIQRERAVTPKVKEGLGKYRSRIERQRIPTRGKKLTKGRKPPKPYPYGRSGRRIGSITRSKIDTGPKGKRNIGGSRRTAQTLGPVNPIGRRQGEATAAMFGSRRALTIIGTKKQPGLAKLGDRLYETAKQMGMPVTKKDRRLVIQFLGSLPINESAVKGTFDIAKTKLGASLTQFLDASGLSPSSAKGVNAVAFTMWRHAGKPNPGTKAFEAVVQEMTAMIKQGSFIQQMQIGTAPVGGSTNLGALPPEAWRNKRMVEWPHLMTATAGNIRKPHSGQRLGRREFLSPLPSYGEAGFAGLGQVGQLEGAAGGKHALLGEQASVRQLMTGIAKHDKLKPGPTANISRLGTTHAQNLIGDQFVAENIGKRQPKKVVGLPGRGITQGGSKGAINLQRRVIQELMETSGGLLFFLSRAMKDESSGRISISKRMQALAEQLGITVQTGEGAMRVGETTGISVGRRGPGETGTPVLKEGERLGRMSPDQIAKLREQHDEARRVAALGTEKGMSQQRRIQDILSEGLTSKDPELKRESKRLLREFAAESDALGIDDTRQRKIAGQIAAEQEGARTAARSARKGQSGAVQFGRRIAKGGGAAGLILLALLALPALLNLGGEGDARAA